VLWDQGEDGTGLPLVDQYTLMGALIRGWRKDWAQGDFPFIYIQKSNGGGCAWDTKNPVTRNAKPFEPLPAYVDKVSGSNVENHIRIMRYPNTAMAISSDLEPGNHPTNKSGYGHRASDVALGMVYGRKIEYYGPTYDSHVVEGNKLRIRFNHVGQGLAIRHGDKLQGFAVAGADKVFHWADASIDGETVVVSNEKVSQPVAVRYAWSGRRAWANLFNKDGLPALSFRTDQW
jgi:sialate O-acetylesterase